MGKKNYSFKAEQMGDRKIIHLLLPSTTTSRFEAKRAALETTTFGFQPG